MRIVVKIGSSSLVDERGQRQLGLLGHLVEDISAVVAEGHQVVLVSSGAIATGLGILGRDRRPTDLPALQAASAVGQGALFGTWSQLFELRGVRAAQVLLTMHDAAHRASWINARATLEQLLEWGVVPIVNENDTTATDEITFGDNDTLAAQVAVSLGAQTLVLLTDTDGLYTEHPSRATAELITMVDDHSLLHRIDTATPGSHWGSGGMRSKVVAAEMASVGGTTTFITRSTDPRVIGRIAAGQHSGTCVAADARRGSSYKLWLRYATRPAGRIVIDEGARRAVCSGGASLLAVGVVRAEGDFRPGDVVDVVGEDGHAIARGVSEYSAADLTRLAGDGQAARGAPASIHRDELVLLDVAPV